MQKNSGSAVSGSATRVRHGAFIPDRFHLKQYIKSHSVRYWEPDWLFRFTIVFQLNNGKNIWSSLKMQWQLPYLTNDCIVWPWSAKQLIAIINWFGSYYPVIMHVICNHCHHMRGTAEDSQSNVEGNVRLIFVRFGLAPWNEYMNRKDPGHSTGI